MANPTTYYAWEFPQAGEDPWYAKFDRLISNIDLSVHSIEALLRSMYKTTVVWSFQPGRMISYARVGYPPIIPQDGDINFDNPVWPMSDTSLPSASSSWVVSISPVGPVFGAFTVPFSGAKVRLRMHAPAYCQANWPSAIAGKPVQIGSDSAVGGVVVHYRLIDGTQISTLNLLGDSAWKWEYTYNTVFEYPEFTAVVSLGTGTYFVELQARLYYWGVNTACLATHAYGGPWVMYATLEI